jgi:hypothetical protein
MLPVSDGGRAHAGPTIYEISLDPRPWAGNDELRTEQLRRRREAEMLCRFYVVISWSADQL